MTLAPHWLHGWAGWRPGDGTLARASFMLQPTSLFFLTYFAILASQVGAFSNFLRYADTGRLGEYADSQILQIVFHIV
ncbi:hypothetical protein [Ralstonia mannitolilytica]|uniref:hypothetical protein n=1 Tax=Ralstonia mannitolilytica TaxID=105219 RepID=UPI0012FD3594|nr:hypothetical protein [Ralstonia mannitolilytica]